MTRTTFAVTTLAGSPAINVVAQTARAGVNIRVMVGDTVADALDHVRRAVGDDQVRVDVVEGNEPSPVSPRDDAFALLERTIEEVFPDAVPAPYVMMAATDSRFFTEICERVYRFAPFRMTRRSARPSTPTTSTSASTTSSTACAGTAGSWKDSRHEHPDRARRATRGLAAIVGFLVCVELASGILQGYYTPIFSDIADHLDIKDADVNWFEAAQLVVSALLVPPLARLGDLVGHKKVLLLSTAVTAVGSWVLVFAPSFSTFLVGWALQGAYVVWLPLEVAIIYRRTAGTGRQGAAHPAGGRDAGGRARAGGDRRRAHLRRAGGVDVDDGAADAARDRRHACLVVVWFGVEDAPGTAPRAASTGPASPW